MHSFFVIRGALKNVFGIQNCGKTVDTQTQFEILIKHIVELIY